MRPLRLTATNYVRFPSLAVTFTEGSTACTGGNGSGKSTLLRGVELALFADGSRDLAQWLGPLADRVELALTFEHDGETYRVRRTFRGGASAKATLDLDLGIGRAEGWDTTVDGPEYGYIGPPSRWEPLTLATAKETQAELERLTGLNRRTFGASSYLAQGQAGSFTEASPADRKGILSDALDPRGYWPKIAQQATDERKAAERNVEADRVRVEERVTFLTDTGPLDVALDDRQAEQAQARRAVDDADEALAVAQAAVAGNAAAVERLKAAQAAEGAEKIEHARAFNALEDSRGFAEKLEPARAELAETEQQAGRATELERLVEEQREAVAAVALATERKQAAEANARQLAFQARELSDAFAGNLERIDLRRRQIDVLRQAADDAQRCDRCEQFLGKEARQAAIASLRREYDGLLDANDDAQGAMEAAVEAAVKAKAEADTVTIPEMPAATVDYRAQLVAARAAAERLSGLRERIAVYDAAQDRLPALDAALGQAEAELERRTAESARAAAECRDDAELQQAAASARERQTQARTALDVANAAVTRLEAMMERVRQAEAELADHRVSLTVNQEQADLLRLAERAFGRDGIPTLIVENALAQIEANASGYLAMMPTTDGTTLRVQLETQRAQKTTEHMRETLDVLVSDQDGARPYETYSGGERARVNIALRLALAILLADRRGAESRLLAIDEVDGLDAQGRAQLVDVIRTVEARFDVCLIVSHHEDLRDAFDSVIRVEKVDGVSRIAA